MSENDSFVNPPNSVRHAWGAVVAMALCAGMLIASEFLPVSLLTPIASELHITEGHAGQSISISGLFALLTSLFISVVIGRTDRRRIVLLFTALAIVSGCTVTLAPNAAVLMVGRALLGVSVGGFWSVSAAILMRLVPKASVHRALAILNGGNALASTLAAPLGSYLGSIIGWRGAFFFLIPLGLVVIVWQRLSLPPLPATPKAQRSPVAALSLLEQPHICLGMLSVGLLFMGQFMLFTYLRPFLEIAGKVSPNVLSLTLLGIGVAGFMGTWIIGKVLRSRLYSLLIAIPSIMGFIAIALSLYGTSLGTTVPLLLLWGLTGTSAPVAWWTWLSKTLPHDAEAGGGLMVAIIQLGIMLGAAGGGVLYDLYAYHGAFICAAALLFAGSLLTLVARHTTTTTQALVQTA